MKHIFNQIKTVILLICLIFTVFANAQQVYTIGPMFHVNFGNKIVTTSWGVEAAFWDFSSVYPVGFDLGLEWQKPKFRMYTEAQTGIYFAGTSGGFGCEFQKENSPKLFLQGSVWANAFIGLDFRFRTTKEGYFAPGIYTKIPIIPGGLTHFNEEYEKNHPDNKNNYSDFDWD